MPKNRTDDDVLRWELDGVTYRLDPKDMTARREMALARATDGLLTSVGQIMAELQKAPATYHIAALTFLARLASGERDVSFDEIADSISYVTDIDLEFARADSDAAGSGPPEASAAD